MHVDFLIIGQGISGTWLSYFLQKERCSFCVIDNNDPSASSRLAAGVINPVTGRRHVKVWMADTLLPFCRAVYREAGEELGIPVLSEKILVDFFPSPQMRLSFMERVDEKANYLSIHNDKPGFHTQFEYAFGSGQVDPVFIAQLEQFLPAWRARLKENGQLLEEDFDRSKLSRGKDKIFYKDISASLIIFCDGIQSLENPLFKELPFSPNKGEILIAEIPGLPANYIYKKSLVLVPLTGKDQWWVGSSYAWEYSDILPTAAFRDNAEKQLGAWLKIPFRILDHQAGIRPATLERRPFVGIHPRHPSVAILNGMGSKGCSLAPYFAKQLCRHILYGETISPEADISRFNRLLSSK